MTPLKHYKRRTLRAKLTARGSAGYSLVEILIALGVFAIGMIAVASLFPVAALLQKETVDEVIGENAARSAKALVEAKALSFAPASSAQTGDLDNYHSLAGTTLTDAIPLRAVSAQLLTRTYTAQDRSYPTAQVNTATRDVSDCDLHWVPFIQDIAGDATGTSQNWVLRLFLVEGDSTASYPHPNSGNASHEPNAANAQDPVTIPKVIPTSCTIPDVDVFRLGVANHGLRPEDVVLDSNGNDHIITEVNGADITVLNRIPLTPATPNTIWYAPPYDGNGSPGVRVMTVKINVVNLP